MISVDKLRHYTKIRASKAMLKDIDYAGEVGAEDEIVAWLETNKIWDWELIGEYDGDHGPCYFFVFADARCAAMFALRWS